MHRMQAALRSLKIRGIHTCMPYTYTCACIYTHVCMVLTHKYACTNTYAFIYIHMHTHVQDASRSDVSDIDSWNATRTQNGTRGTAPVLDGYVCICVMCVCVCVYVYMYVYMYVCVYVCVYVLCMCVCLHACIYGMHL